MIDDRPSLWLSEYLEPSIDFIIWWLLKPLQYVAPNMEGSSSVSWISSRILIGMNQSIMSKEVNLISELNSMCFYSWKQLVFNRCMLDNLTSVRIMCEVVSFDVICRCNLTSAKTDIDVISAFSCSGFLSSMYANTIRTIVVWKPSEPELSSHLRLKICLRHSTRTEDEPEIRVFGLIEGNTGWFRGEWSKHGRRDNEWGLEDLGLNEAGEQNELERESESWSRTSIQIHYDIPGHTQWVCNSGPRSRGRLGRGQGGKNEAPQWRKAGNLKIGLRSAIAKRLHADIK